MTGAVLAAMPGDPERVAVCPYCWEGAGYCVNGGGTQPCAGEHIRAANIAAWHAAPIVHIGAAR